jgi:N-acetylated-alpha-linked acidic dipeptidase
LTRLSLSFSLATLLLTALLSAQSTPSSDFIGYRDFAAEQAKVDESFLAVPDPKLAGEELKTLTAEPHIAASPEDHKTAEYVASKFREAGLDTSIEEYKAWLNMPVEVRVQAWDANGKLLMTGPVPERVDGDDPYQNDPRITPAFNGSSPSGDVTGEVVYANYCRPEDYDKLASMGVDVKGKIVLCR